MTASLDKVAGLTKYEDYNPKKAKEHLNSQKDWDKNDFKFSKRNLYVRDIDDLDLTDTRGVSLRL